MDLGEARVFKIDMLRNVALSDFTMAYDLGAANHYDFVNTQAGYDGLNAIHLTAVSGTALTNTNWDINFHGSPDTGNDISVARAVLDYNPALDTSGENSIWAIVSSGGASHAATDTFVYNGVAFNYAVGSTANDVIHGTDANDYLNAGFGYDSILGGGGDEYIVGGTRKDTMTGGEDSDTFLLRMGDGLDTITDFTFGVDGDIIIYSGNSAVTSMANLTFTQNGDDLYVCYGSNSTVILAGQTLADVDAANFAFDPGGAPTLAAYNGDFLL